MDKQRFRLGTILAAFSVMFQGRQAREMLAPEAPAAHDEFHHSRGRCNYTAGEKHRSRLKAKRRVRNAMAKASRKRNR